MPAAPVIEKIALNLLDTLNGVKIEAGYSIDLVAERRRRAGNNPAHGKCVIMQGASARDFETTGATDGTIFRRCTFLLQVYIITSEKADDPEDSAINYVTVDIEKALMLDAQRGQNAHETIVLDPEPFDEGEDGYSGVFIPLDVQYGYLESDPTTPI